MKAPVGFPGHVLFAGSKDGRVIDQCFQDGMSEALDTLLAGYAAGMLCPPLHALVGGHLELTPANRAFVAALESAKAGDLERSGLRPLSNRDAALAAIFADPAPAPCRLAEEDGSFLPRALRHYLRMECQDIPWRSCAPGVKEYRVERRDPGEVSLLWVGEGRRLPSHAHSGQEVMLVLAGGCTEAVGRLRRGDIAIIDAELPHGPIADKTGDCYCFCVADAGLALPVSRLTRPITRH